MPSTPSSPASGSSSPLSSLSRSPSRGPMCPYPTPPSSQTSEKGATTPTTEEDSLTNGSSDRDGPPPKKRRKTDDNVKSSKMPREMKRLDFDKMARDPTLESSVQLDRLLKALRKKRKIVVIAGAGISVSAGIPDFRSSTGLFKTLRETHNLKGSGKQLFDAGVYRDANSTSTFHTMVREMSSMSAIAEPTAFHHLVARLAHEGRLLRLYSQNVDGLENKLEPLRTAVPLPTKAPWPKTVQLHGGLEKMICSKCNTTSDFDGHLFDQDLPPECAECQALDHTRTEVAGKRSHGIGRMRPRMTLYNETGPDDEAIGACSSADLKTRPDCVLVVGTTLSVPGVRRIVRETCAIVRDRKDGLSVWVNLEQEPAGKDLENAWDLVVTGKADDLAHKAALGRWDDPEVVAEVKEDQVEKMTVHVTVPSPRKSATYFDPVLDAARTNELEALAQPLENEAPAESVIVETVELPVREVDGSKTENPASKGRKLDDVLGKENKTAAGKKTRKPRTKANKSQVKAAPKKAAAQVNNTRTREPKKQGVGIKANFSTSKQPATVEAKDKPSSDVENSQSKKGKGAKAVKPAVSEKRASKQLNEVPPVDERVNHSTDDPASAPRPIFPNLNRN
ncbi:MAG: hypothetical protein Q9162_002650 [Coniocarpon cinnabarinum]